MLLLLEGRFRLERQKSIGKKWKGKETYVNFDAHFRKTSVQYMLFPQSLQKCSNQNPVHNRINLPQLALKRGRGLPTSNVMVCNTPKEKSIQL